MKLSSHLPHLLLIVNALALPSPSTDLLHPAVKRNSLAHYPSVPGAAHSLVRRDSSSSDNTINLCHSPTSKYYIHLLDPAVKNITLYINTPWIILYPKQLRPKLLAAGFTFTTPRGQAQCGWTVVDEVSAASVSRGDIGYRPTAGLDANKTLVPSEETVAQLRQILLGTYPSLEIALVVGLLVALPVSVCFCCVCGRAVSEKVKRRARSVRMQRLKPQPKPRLAAKRKTKAASGAMVDAEKVHSNGSQDPPPYS